MKKLRPDQQAELEKALAARAEHERRLAEKGITVEEEMADLRRFGEDCRYLGDHWDELLKQYPNHWVAVYRKEVIAAASTQEELIKQVSDKGHRPGKIAMKFLDTNPPILIL